MVNWGLIGGISGVIAVLLLVGVGAYALGGGLDGVLPGNYDPAGSVLDPVDLTDPDAESGTGKEYFDRTVVVNDQRVFVDNSWCADTTTYLASQELNWETDVFAKDDLWEGHPLAIDPEGNDDCVANGAFLGCTIENKYTQICQTTDTFCAPDKVGIVLEGTATVLNDFSVDEGWGYDLVTKSVVVDNVRPPLGIFSNDGKIELYIETNGGNRISDIVVKEFDVTKGQDEIISFQIPYKVYDVNCDDKPDDHSVNLIYKLYGQDGELLEGPIKFSVGLINGEPIPARYG